MSSASTDLCWVGEGCFQRTLVGLGDSQTMLCVAGDFNAHVVVVEAGDEESIGRFGWGTMKREGQERVEMLRRNELEVA